MVLIFLIELTKMNGVIVLAAGALAVPLVNSMMQKPTPKTEATNDYLHELRQHGVHYDTFQNLKNTLPLAAEHMEKGTIHPIQSEADRKRQEKHDGKLGHTLQGGIFDGKHDKIMSARREMSSLIEEQHRQTLLRLNRKQGNVQPSANTKPIVTTFTPELIHPNSGRSTSMIDDAFVPARPTDAAIKRRQADFVHRRSSSPGRGRILPNRNAAVEFPFSDYARIVISPCSINMITTFKGNHKVFTCQYTGMPTDVRFYVPLKNGKKRFCTRDLPTLFSQIRRVIPKDDLQKYIDIVKEYYESPSVCFAPDPEHLQWFGGEKTLAEWQSSYPQAEAWATKGRTKAQTVDEYLKNDAPPKPYNHKKVGKKGQKTHHP